MGPSVLGSATTASMPRGEPSTSTRPSSTAGNQAVSRGPTYSVSPSTSCCAVSPQARVRAAASSSRADGSANRTAQPTTGSVPPPSAACQPACSSTISSRPRPHTDSSTAMASATRGPSDRTKRPPSSSATISAGRTRSTSCEPGGR
ncbi:MAG: hypothetical protein EBX36_04720 [Planctomycetia bacterium]|nr:hypothetical protein [Planctomycetia bacterium]